MTHITEMAQIAHSAIEGTGGGPPHLPTPNTNPKVVIISILLGAIMGTDADTWIKFGTFCVIFVINIPNYYKVIDFMKERRKKAK